MSYKLQFCKIIKLSKEYDWLNILIQPTNPYDTALSGSKDERLSRTSKKSDRMKPMAAGDLYGKQTISNLLFYHFHINTIGSPTKKDIGVISIHELREIRNKTVKGLKPDAAIISG